MSQGWEGGRGEPCLPAGMFEWQCKGQSSPGVGQRGVACHGWADGASSSALGGKRSTVWKEGMLLGTSLVSRVGRGEQQAG